jgi:hypothetical protein
MLDYAVAPPNLHNIVTNNFQITAVKNVDIQLSAEILSFFSVILYIFGETMLV